MSPPTTAPNSAPARRPQGVGDERDRAAQRPGRRDRAGAPKVWEMERDRAAQRPGRRDRAGAPKVWEMERDRAAQRPGRRARAGAPQGA